jgi:hypothetical protein
MSKEHQKTQKLTESGEYRISMAEVMRAQAGPVTERARIVGELIDRILNGVETASTGYVIDSSHPSKARITRSNLVGLGSSVPASFTLAQLQELFGGQTTAVNEQIARRQTGVSLFSGLLGALDAMAQTVEQGKPVAPGDIETVFAKRTAQREARGRVAVRHDLRLHRSYDVSAQRLSDTTSVWDKLMDAGFYKQPLRRILTCLAYIREGFALQRGPDGKIDPDQKGNWLHTIDELDAILDRTAGCPMHDVERAIMGMFGDSWKTKYNFTRHNYDGAAVAQTVLSRMLDNEFTAQDVTGIVEANKEHQVSPPGLMGILYVNKIAGALNSQRAKRWGELVAQSKARTLEAKLQSELAYWTELAMEHDYRQFQVNLLADQALDRQLAPQDENMKQRLEDRIRLGSFITDEDYATLASLRSKLGNPYAYELERTARGGMVVKMTNTEQAFFRLSGIDYWHVPHQSTPWYWVSRTGVIADILANLGLGGRCKLTRLNGPETDPVFQFPTIRDCINSGLKTYADVDKILSPEEFLYVQSRLGTMNSGIELAMRRVAAWLREEEHSQNNQPLAELPFWDVPLKYPKRGVYESEWWDINRIPQIARTAEQQQFWEEHRFDGLTDQDKKDYLRAIKIRDRAVEELGKELRLDNKFIPDFKPVMSGYQAFARE